MIWAVTNGLHRRAGTERVICNLSKALSKFQEYSVIVPGDASIAFAGDYNFLLQSVKIGDLPQGKFVLTKLYHRLLYFCKLWKMVGRGDTLIGFSFDLNVICIVISHLTGARAICCEHIHYHYHNRARRIVRSVLYASPKASVVVLTESDRKCFERVGVPSTVIPNFIDKQEQSVYSRKSFAKKKIVSVGRLVSQKNYIYLLQSFYTSKVWSRGWRLEIIGEGEERDLLIAWIEENEMTDCIAILPPTGEIQPVYNDASLFCMTSKFEAFPMVLLEAMNAGLPILTTDCPTGPREIIGDDDLGQILPMDNIGAFSAALEEACESFEICLQRSARNLMRVREFNTEKIVEKWQSLLDTVKES